MGDGNRKTTRQHPRGYNVITGPVNMGEGAGRGGWSGVPQEPGAFASSEDRVTGHRPRNAEASRRWQREGAGAPGKECSPPHALTLAQ